MNNSKRFFKRSMVMWIRNPYQFHLRVFVKYLKRFCEWIIFRFYDNRKKTEPNRTEPRHRQKQIKRERRSRKRNYSIFAIDILPVFQFIHKKCNGINLDITYWWLNFRICFSLHVHSPSKSNWLAISNEW